MSVPMPTLPVAVSTKRFEFNDRFSPVFATMFEVVRVLSEPMTMFDVMVSWSVWKILERVSVLPSVTNTFADMVSWSEWKMLETVMVPMFMGASAGIETGACMEIESALMVRGEAPVIVEAERVWHLMSPTTSSVLVGSVVPMPTLDVVEMTKVFWSPTLDVFWGAVMKK